MSTPAKSRTILIGVCGGIAAYKTVEVVSHLRQQGHDVHVAMSEAACKFVTPLTFAAVSGNRVLTQAFPDSSRESSDNLYPHLYPATRADLFVLMPATANMIGRMAQGLGNEMVSMCVLSLPAHCRRIFCPSMNVEMWQQQVVQEGVRLLESRGWTRLGPETGTLACGMEGAGRLVESARVLEQIDQSIQKAESLRGRRVLILSGPTREHLDPVRYIGNASSGRMGQALAEEAADRGAQVTFVTGPVDEAHLPRRPSITLTRVVRAQEMLDAARTPFRESGLAIFAAAVADYRPVHTSTEKTGKKSGNWSLDMEATCDIAATLATEKREDQMTVGFALQTGDGLKEAVAKLESKRLDAIVLNHPDSINAESGAFTFIHKDRAPAVWGRLDKRRCAARLLDECG